jgi:hypothetical protein
VASVVFAVGDALGAVLSNGLILVALTAQRPYRACVLSP